MAWRINFWARMFDGNHAYKLLRNLMSVVGNVVKYIGGVALIVLGFYFLITL